MTLVMIFKHMLKTIPILFCHANISYLIYQTKEISWIMILNDAFVKKEPKIKNEWEHNIVYTFSSIWFSPDAKTLSNQFFVKTLMRKR